MAYTRPELQAILNDVEEQIPAFIAEHGTAGDACGLVAGIAEQAVEGGILAEDDDWFHDRLRDICAHFGIGDLEI